MAWVWVTVGVAIGIAALFVVMSVIVTIYDKAAATKATIRRRQYEAEAAMVSTVQDTIQQMFDATRGVR